MGETTTNNDLLKKIAATVTEPHHHIIVTYVDSGLRYDLTVPLCRFYSNNANELPSPFKALQIGNVFRADRPQRGRFRQFMQCDIDILGEPTNLAEIDVILATSTPVGKDLESYKSECHHGTAYTKMIADYSEIRSEVRYYVPLNQSYEVWNLSVTNASQKERELSIIGYAEFTNNSNYEQDQVNPQYSQFITRTVFKENRVRQMIHANQEN